MLALDSCLIVLLNVALAKCKSTRVYDESSLPIVKFPVGFPADDKVNHVPVFALVVAFKDIEFDVRFDALLAVIFVALVFVIRISFVVVNHLLCK